jgi:hypothetical protein
MKIARKFGFAIFLVMFTSNMEVRVRGLGKTRLAVLIMAKAPLRVMAVDGVSGGFF